MRARGAGHVCTWRCGLYGSSLPEKKPKERGGTCRSLARLNKGRGSPALSYKQLKPLTGFLNWAITRSDCFTEANPLACTDDASEEGEKGQPPQPSREGRTQWNSPSISHLHTVYLENQTARGHSAFHSAFALKLTRPGPSLLHSSPD